MSLLCVLAVNDWTTLVLYCQTPLLFHANDVIVRQKVAIVAYFLVRVSTRGNNLHAEILAPANSGALLGAPALPLARLHFSTEKQL